MTVAKPASRPNVPHFSSGPCAKRPGWTPQNLKDAALGRSHRAKIGKAKLKLAIELTREVLEVPADYKIGIVPASDTGAVEMALWSLLGARPGHHDRLGILRRRLGQRHRQGIEAQGRHQAACRLWRTSRSVQGRSGVRHRLHLERHHLGRARAECRLDQRRPRRPHHLRRDLGRVRAAARLGQARCRDLLLAEGAGRRSRARHADPVAARGGAARELQAGLAAAEDLPHDQGRQAQRGHLRRRDHQHAVDAVRRGLSRRAELGEVDRRPQGPDRARRRQHQGAGRLEGEDAVDRFPGEGSGDPLQHLGVPEGRRSRDHVAVARTRRRTSPRSWSRWSRRKAPATTSRITAMRRRACASGAAPRWKPPMSRC